MARCEGCGLQHQCICHLIPKLTPDWSMLLLTHANELRRETNTGRWLTASMDNCQLEVWDRTCPPQALIDKINNQQVSPLLLYPATGSSQLTAKHLNDPPHPLVIILDATWQEARKMYNRTPWLQALPHFHLVPEQNSEYHLRRNQQQGHLCTCEVGIEVLKCSRLDDQAHQLERFFALSLDAFKADKSGHALKSITSS
ncbi:DTW domain-containing protein [Vibrio sp. SCSIO 43136]|uniref:tRNA-uridine aminocarboxypropyltransferase n=1 Tax=Vibrio sp. SCSIO 43136 TaxID=2819101 RepID=UPI0020761697|nr:DTW domain-containing protein [Vibrio sp. SCSIO 43136]USD65371.1 DTW domain-containing protein [Vibrio sp. SCSIO 43136]